MSSPQQDSITPIMSSGEEEYNEEKNDNNSNDNMNVETQHQNELTENLRILERQRYIEQLITSEGKYCDNLKKLITLYLEPLSNHLSSQDEFILFGDVKTMYEKNVQFSIALDQRYKEFDPTRTLIGDEILKYFDPNLRSLYQNYVNRHEQASKLLISLRASDSKFTKICGEAQIKASIDISHLLLLPINRINKYESIINDILLNTSELHLDYNNLSQCVKDINNINQLINEKMKEFSEREVVRKIANAIQGKESLKLETPYRKFIKNGYLIKMGKTKPQRYLFFLFNDLLMYCKRVGHDNNKDDHNNNNNNNNKDNNTDDTDSLKSEDSNISIKISHDYSDTSDLHQITSLFNDNMNGSKNIKNRNKKTRKSRTKLFSDDDDNMDEFSLHMNSFGMNVDIHNEIDVYDKLQTSIGQFKVHNLMPIDEAFNVSDFRIFPQRYEHKAFEIRSSIKSFIVVAESDKSKKEWMKLLEHCTYNLKTNPILSNNPSNSHSNNNKQKIRPVTLYLPTNFTEQCMKCAKQFGYSRRKNWCHHCGLLVCSKCLTEKLPSLIHHKSKKDNTTHKVCSDCYTKNKHFFPEFEEASALSTNARSKIFAYKQKSKRKQIKNKNKKKKKFKIFKNKSNLNEDVEHDDFYEKGSIKSLPEEINNNNNIKSLPNNNDNIIDDDDDEELSENEPSMLSIPENDDHIETLIIAHNEYEPSVSSHLAPHWTPHSSNMQTDTLSTATTSGHHNRDFSHNLNESGYADNDSDSDSDNGINNNQFNKLLDVSNDILNPNSSANENENENENENDRITSEVTPPISPYYDDTPLMDDDKIYDAMKPSHPIELRQTNSLNIGNVLDELEREQQERREEEDFGDDEQIEKINNVIDNTNNNTNNNRESNVLKAIPEYEDTDDGDETSANDTDAVTAFEHMRNLSTHIEDQEFMTHTINGDSDDSDDDSTSMKLKIRNSLKIKIQRNGSHDSPGNTPPPISPRYKKMSLAHKRKLSDKLDKFMKERAGPQQLIGKNILYTTPEEDIEKLKEKIQIKREERDKIKKRLKRKLSHDFRPTEQEIEDRGIKIVPEIIRSDEEDGDEEIIVYKNGIDRNSFSLKKINKKNKLKKAIQNRPTVADIIEKGYINSEHVNNHIPPINTIELINRLKAELKSEMIDNNKYKMEKKQIDYREKRRNKILNFYHNYLFNYTFDDDSDDNIKYPINEQYIDIDMDYQQIIQNNSLKNYQNIEINNQEISLEKEWMRNLRKRKFKTYINKNKYKMLQIKRDSIEMKLNQLNQQIQLVENTNQIDKLGNEVDRLEKQRLTLIQNTSKQINELRDIIRDLNKLNSKKNTFITIL